MRTETGKTGRPIGFDKDAALEAAMLLFWERGFEGASMADLAEAMGLSASSIYAAFGDKRSLFTHAVTRYLNTRAQYTGRAPQMPTLDSVVRALFDNTVAFLTSPGHPPTCMSLAGTMGCSVDAAPAKDLMTAVRKQNEAAIRQRLLEARRAGELSQKINVDDTPGISRCFSPVCPYRQPMDRLSRNSSARPRWPFGIWGSEGRAFKLLG